MKQTPSSTRAVFFPDLILRAIEGQAHSRFILQRWRDGLVQPVSNRELLQCQLRLLGRLRLTETVMRRWVWWLTSEKTAAFNVHDFEGVSEVVALCHELARMEKVPVIFGRAASSGHWPPSRSRHGVQWFSAEEWDEKLGLTTTSETTARVLNLPESANNRRASA